MISMTAWLLSLLTWPDVGLTEALYRAFSQPFDSRMAATMTLAVADVCRTLFHSSPVSGARASNRSPT